MLLPILIGQNSIHSKNDWNGSQNVEKKNEEKTFPSKRLRTPEYCRKEKFLSIRYKYERAYLEQKMLVYYSDCL